MPPPTEALTRIKLRELERQRDRRAAFVRRSKCLNAMPPV
jgi:hypothetical protein